MEGRRVHVRIRAIANVNGTCRRIAGIYICDRKRCSLTGSLNHRRFGELEIRIIYRVNTVVDLACCDGCRASNLGSVRGDDERVNLDGQVIYQSRQVLLNLRVELFY